MDKELGAELDQPADLTHFLTEGTAPDQKDIPCSTAGLHTSTKSPQHGLAPAGRAWPKAPIAASSHQSQARPGRERPDPVSYPQQWISEELSQSNNPYPHWWKEIKASGELNTGACIMQEEYDKQSAHYTLWQAAAFRLPLVQQEASGWWDTLPALPGLCLQDFLPPASDPQNFWFIHQEYNWL